MRRVFIFIVAVSFILLLNGCGAAQNNENEFNIDSIKTYHEIPGITDEEIAAFEAIKASRSVFIYGQMLETEAFILPDGTTGGFAAKFCDMLTSLFGIEFRLQLYEWDELMTGLSDMVIDFTVEQRYVFVGAAQ